MSVESAWDAELAAAGESMGDDVDRHLNLNRARSEADIDLDAIKARCEAATPGPWTPRSMCSNPRNASGVEDWDSTSTAGLGFEVEGPPYPDLDRYRFESGMDAVFIAHARTDVPALLDAIERLRSMLIDAETEAQMQAAEVERLRVALDFYANPEHWEPVLIEESPAEGPNPGASLWESGPANDSGERARRALNVEVDL